MQMDGPVVMAIIGIIVRLIRTLEKTIKDKKNCRISRLDQINTVIKCGWINQMKCQKDQVTMK